MARATIVIGLGFGDEGKGAVVDYLTRESGAKLVVRFSGGANAKHAVMDERGYRHRCSQFGSGVLAGARTHLSFNVVVDPLEMRHEARALFRRYHINDPLSLVSVDPRCLVVTPYHVVLGRFRELLRRDAPHGSCGRGVGECRRDAERCAKSGIDALTVGDCADAQVTEEKLARTRERLVFDWRSLSRVVRNGKALRECREMWDSEPLSLARIYHGWHRRLGGLEHADVVILEGSQGVLLDERVGFYPYVTRGRVTIDAARQAMADLSIEDYTTVGVTRSYLTRHGVGPFPPCVYDIRADGTNGPNRWQGRMRTSYLDPALLRYAVAHAGAPLDCVAITHMDRAPLRVWSEDAVRGILPCDGFERPYVELMSIGALYYGAARQSVVEAGIPGLVESIARPASLIYGFGPSAREYGRSMTDIPAECR